MSFREIAGHRALTELIARAIDRGSLPPSLLFVGPDGVGKRLVATAVAQTLNCATPTRRPATSSAAQGDVPSGEYPLDGCGTCASCERIVREVHPDVLVVRPGENGAIPIDAVRHAVGQAVYRPFEGRRRVVVVDDADRLVPHAQNALLKTLEEPPDSSQFILVTARPDTLLATVRSRCQRLTFGQLGPADISDVLTRVHGFDEPSARAAAASAGGSVGQALLLASGELTEAREAAATLLETVARARDMSTRLEGAKVLVAGKKSGRSGVGGQRQILVRRLRALASLLRDTSLVASGGDGAALANSDLPDRVASLSRVFDPARGVKGFAVVGEAIVAAEGNASPKVVADWVACQL
jgi:DNA polymerase-3 subunit delta'